MKHLSTHVRTEHIRGGARKKSNNDNKSKQTKFREFSLVGVNVDGIRGKSQSFRAMISELKPGVFVIQETKLNEKGFLRIKGFQIFEKVRKNKIGGGIAIGVRDDLKPVWVSEAEDEIEAMAVVIKVGKREIRVVGGYGPQESSGKLENKIKFWQYLDHETKEAEKHKQDILIQMDANAWLGNELLPNDPRTQNKNGKLFEAFLNSNPELNLSNISERCKGLITRQKEKKGKLEQSIIDFVVMNKNLEEKMVEMIIDEKGEFAVSNYNKNNKNVIDTDHNVLKVKFKLEVKARSKKNIKVINYNDTESLKKFKEATEEDEQLKNCFETNETIEEQMTKFVRRLTTIIMSCFKTIRIREVKPEVVKNSRNFLKRNKLKAMMKRMKMCDCSNIDNVNKKSKTEHKEIKEKCKCETSKELTNVEKEIKQHLEEVNAKEMAEAMKKYENINADNINIRSMWKEFNKVGQNKRNGRLTAKINHDGVEIIDEEDITKAFSKEITERLRKRPTREDFKELDNIENELFKEYMKSAADKKTDNWKIEELEEVLKSLKVKKARDHQGLAAIIFKKENCGKQLKLTLFRLLNLLKQTKIVTPNLLKALVTCIGKQGSLKILKNHRGIFNVSILRSIMMKLIYNRNYDNIENNLSEFNVGARKEKSSLINIFVINSIINEVIRDPTKTPITISVLDFSQMFDSLDLTKAANRMFENGFNNEELVLVVNANKQVTMAVKNGNNLSEFTEIQNVVLQGDTLAPLIATTDMDQIAKDWQKKAGNEQIYKYKDSVEAGTLGMIDDLLLIAEAGVQTTILNAFINAEAAARGLQFGVSKCVQLKVQKKKKVNLDNKIKVDEWVHEREDGVVKDVFKGKVEIKHTKVQKYLGIMLQDDGKNTATIEMKVAKAKAVTKTITNKLNSMKLNKYFIETLVLLRNSIFTSSLLYGTEVLFNLTQEEIKILNRADEHMLKEVLGLESTTPGVLLAEELGLEPVEVMIKKKRAGFYKYLLDHRKELASEVFQKQAEDPMKGDWAKVIKIDLEDLKIDMSEEDIENMPKKVWKKMVNSNARELAVKIYMKKKTKLKKGKMLEQTELKLKNYLKAESNLNKKEMLEALRLRIEMLKLPKNLPHKFDGKKQCRFECPSDEDILHAVKCEKDNIENKINAKEVEHILTNGDGEIKRKYIRNLIKLMQERQERINNIVQPDE